MTDFTLAAQDNACARLSDGSEVTLYFNSAGTEGWLVDVIYAYNHHDDILFWNLDGLALGHDDNIVEIV